MVFSEPAATLPSPDPSVSVEALREEMAAKWAASEASIQKLSDALTEVHGQLSALQPSAPALESKWQASIEDEAYSKPTSLFAYCMEEIIKPDQTAFEFIRVCLLLLVLTVAQYIMIFAFYDAVWWDAEVGRRYPAFQEPLELHNFYVRALHRSTSLRYASTLPRLRLRSDLHDSSIAPVGR